MAKLQEATLSLLHAKWGIFFNLAKGKNSKLYQSNRIHKCKSNQMIINLRDKAHTELFPNLATSKPIIKFGRLSTNKNASLSSHRATLMIR
jgi:hypothetical protein